MRLSQAAIGRLGLGDFLEVLDGLLLASQAWIGWVASSASGTVL